MVFPLKPDMPPSQILQKRCRSLQLCSLIVWVCWVHVVCGLAQQPGSEAEFSSREAIKMRLAAVRKESQALPETATPELRELLRQLESATEFHLANDNLLAAEQIKLATSKQAAASWSGFQQPSPYSILLLDEVRETLATLTNAEDINQAQMSILKSEREALADTLEGQQQAERRLLENADRLVDPDAREHARQQAKIETLGARIVAEKIGRNQLAISIIQVRSDAAAAQIELANRQIKIIGNQTVFTQQELDGLNAQIDREMEAVGRLLLQETRNSETPNTVLTWKLQFLDLTKSFWAYRFVALNSQDRSTVRDAIATLEALRGRIDNWAKISELRLAGGDAETVNHDPAQLRNAVAEVHAMQRRFGFALADLNGWSIRNRGTPLLDKIGSTLQALWNTELYVVEESDIVEGEKIALYRPITVGKLVRLACILVVGWLLLHFLSRRIRTNLSNKHQISQSTADLAGKWARGFGLILLVLYGLQAVRIPLTVFAFLGGALAIGIGFGTQTLIKNFISGVILLFERPLKIGDVVEVASITGTIKQMGLRASVIQHFDGIETLVPNSILLENQLTNWTFSSTIIRHSIVVGVAYGSPTREVARLLLAVAAEHGLVKNEPAPEVRFDDFGPDSLIFTLLFWLDTRKTGRSQLGSDLRFMIDKAFAEAGIVFAFPQRDIHFDAHQPLQVELKQLRSFPLPPIHKDSL